MVGHMMLVETFIFSTWDPNFFFSITWNGFWYVEDKKGITALHEPFFVLHAYFSDAVLNALAPEKCSRSSRECQWSHPKLEIRWGESVGEREATNLRLWLIINYLLTLGIMEIITSNN